MNLTIFSSNGNESRYTQAQLRREALAACKGKGRLVEYSVVMHSNTNTSLVVMYRDKAGALKTTSVAI